MREYAKSRATRLKLINAAGEIIAREGFDNLTIRAVARVSGENISSIHYHFGNKEGLLAATISYAVADWMNHDWQEFIRQREGLFADERGRVRVVCELVELFFELSFYSPKPWWCRRIQALPLMQPTKASEILFTEVIEPNFRLFLEIYLRINPGCNEMAARIWAVQFVSPFVQMSISEETHARLLQTSSYSEEFLQSFKRNHMRNTLMSLGLPIEDCV